MDSSEVPHDVRFAQKASTLVKAAALDPRLLDLEKFRQMAHIIFCRVFHVIYKEKPNRFIDEPQSQDDFIFNAQSVIDALRYKIGGDDSGILHDVTGQDVCFGSHRAIALLVDLLFTEGQKMWLVKHQMKQGYQLSPRVLPEIVGAVPNQYGSVNNSNNNNHSRNYHNPGRPQSADHNRQPRKAGPHKTYTMRNYFDEIILSPDPSSASSPLQAQHDENAYNYLDRNQTQVIQGQTPALIALQDGIVVRQPQNKRNSSLSPPPKKSQQGHRKYIQPNSKKHHDNSNAEFPSDGPELNLEEEEPIVAGDINDILQTYDTPETTNISPRLKRPTSAPLHGKVRQVSERLYNIATVHGVVKFSGAASKKMLSDKKDTHSVAGERGRSHDDVAATKENVVDKEKSDSPSNNFRYDILTGRRVYLPENVMTDSEKRNTKATMGNIRTLEELNQDLNSPRGARPGSPSGRDVAPSWPGERIGKTAKEWIQRQRDFITDKYNHKSEKPFKSGLYRGCGDCGQCAICLTKNNIVKPLNDVIKLYQNARMYKGYKEMEKGDIIVTVEHCFNCEHHCSSLRHDAKMYESHGDSALQTLAQQLYNSKVCCRAGLVRFRSCIKKSSQVSDINSRIGAFEVQIAYCDKEGSVHVELLHSKLATMKWPSKHGLDRKIQEFICRRGIVTHCSGSPDTLSGCDLIEHPVNMYPQGYVSWDELDIGKGGKWLYPSNFVSQIEESDKDGNCNITFNVYWLFDVRSMIGVSIGDSVRVLNLQNPRQNREYRPLLGVIQDKIFENDGTVQLTLAITYTNEVITVDATNIVPNSLYVSPESINLESDDTLPPALDFLFFLIITWQTLKGSPAVEFRLLDSMDEINYAGDLILCRKSYFLQSRSIVAQFEELNPTGIFDSLELSNGFVTHPLTNQKVCLQDAYSENVIHWISFEYMRREGKGGGGDGVNVSDLCRRSNVFTINKLAGKSGKGNNNSNNNNKNNNTNNNNTNNNNTNNNNDNNNNNSSSSSNSNGSPSSKIASIKTTDMHMPMSQSTVTPSKIDLKLLKDDAALPRNSSISPSDDVASP